MNKEELKLILCEDLKRFHEASKNRELYYDECRNKNTEPDNQKVIDLNDAVWDSIQTACGYLEEVNNDFIENIYNLGTIGNELLIFAEAFKLMNQEVKELVSGYLHDLDKTIIFEHTYKDKEQLVKIELVGFYDGQPDEELTKTYATRAYVEIVE
jgi:hypothetical protein